MRLATLFGLLYGMLSVTAAHAQDPAVDHGMKVYASAKCSMCHSVGGKGNAKGVLDNSGAKLSADEIRQWLADPEAMREKTHAERKPFMKSFATLSKNDVDGLVAYLQTLKVKK